jgi:hypothetical protein
MKLQQIKHQQYSVITEESSTARVVMPKNVQGQFEKKIDFDWEQNGPA